MAYSQSDLDAIERAIARGELHVQFADRSVTYRAVGELLQAKADIVKALNAAAPLRSKQTYVTSTKGFRR